MSISKTTIENLRIAIKEDIIDAVVKGDDFSYTSFATGQGSIEVTAIRKNETFSFEIMHDNCNEGECPNIVAALEAEFKDDELWSDAEDEVADEDDDIWRNHGFADEADFWRWKEG